jgi:hypothetical protein
MSGIIDVEGRSEGIEHPLLGEVKCDVTQRRACIDFPPLTWFTDSTRIPGCLLSMDMLYQPKDGGPLCSAADHFGGDKRMMSNAMALHRVALGFQLAGSTIVAWKDHPGYSTGEGRDLNETARDAGDDPDRWYVSNTPVDLMTATEIWTAGSMFEPRLERSRGYLASVKEMVQLCRDAPGMEIAPTWLGNPTVQEMIRQSKASPLRVR